MSTKTEIRAFDIFTKALTRLEKDDTELFNWQRNRLALTHALALRIHELVIKQTKEYSTDMCPVLYKTSRIMNPDIIVHNRKTSDQILSVVCRNDYLTEQEQSELIQLRKNSECELIVAVSFMPQKNYTLIYVATEDKVEYYHFDRNSLTMEPFKKRTLETESESKDQLTLQSILK